MKKNTKYVIAIVLGLIAAFTFGIYMLNKSPLGNNGMWALLSGAFFMALVILAKISDIWPLAERLAEPGRQKQELDEGLRAYLDWVNRFYGRLDLRGIEERERRPHELSLDDVYVSLTVAVEKEDKRKNLSAPGQEQRTIDMRDLLKEGRHIAIVGAPGSGKTTYLRIIAASLARAHLEDNPRPIQRHLGIDGPLPVPVFIALGEYNRYRRTHNHNPDDPEQGTIRGFINYLARKREYKVPEDFFNRLLDDKRPIMVLLDGLDEVADETERRLVATEVQHFVDSNPHAIVFITSRTRAYYGQSRLADFRLVAVQPMTPEQVAELVKRWCDAVYTTDEERKNERDALLKEIEALEKKRRERHEPRLIDTPLMVTVVAIVHYNEHKLPEQRVKLYDKSVDILLAERHHTADESTEELRKWGGDETDKKQFLALLAFNMMSAGEEAGREVDEEQLKAWLAPAFREQYGEEAKNQLQTFIAAIRERGSLLQERDGLYSFVHLTFQEFLCAYYLAQTVRETDKIVSFLIEEERVTQSWWRETILLTMGYIGLDSKPTARELIKKLAEVDGGDERQLAAAELAATAFVELGSQAKAVRRLLHDRLVDLLTTRGRHVQPATRMLAGDALARLGDERPGVCTLEPEMILIDSGLTFKMGEELYEITLEQPFALARYPVTNAQFRFFVEDGGYSNPNYWQLAIAAGRWKEGKYIDHQIFGSRQREQPAHWHDPALSQPNQPVVGITWYEAMAYVTWLREKTGKPYRLPTEAEWERAARFIDGRIYPWGETEPPGPASALANTRELGLGRPTAVGIFPDGAAKEGFLDMAGNVWEWCSAIDLNGGHDAPRRLRGGSYLHGKKTIHCVSSIKDWPGRWDIDRGFRCCATSSLTGSES